MKINKGVFIFNANTYAKTEYGISSDIEITRYTDGNVCISVGSWTDRTDKTMKSYEMTAYEAEALGRALLCMGDNGFDAVVDRAASWAEEANVHERGGH